MVGGANIEIKKIYDKYKNNQSVKLYSQDNIKLFDKNNKKYSDNSTCRLFTAAYFLAYPDKMNEWSNILQTLAECNSVGNTGNVINVNSSLINKDVNNDDNYLFKLYHMDDNNDCVNLNTKGVYMIRKIRDNNYTYINNKLKYFNDFVNKKFAIDKLLEDITTDNNNNKLYKIVIEETHHIFIIFINKDNDNFEIINADT